MTLRLYVRVSTDTQELEGQLRELQTEAQRLAIPDVRTYSEKVSATGKSEREAYDRMMKEALAGDTILVWALDRFSRAERFTQAIDAVLNLEQAGVRFRSLKESFLNTPDEGQPDMARDLLLSILPVIAKWEAKRRSERTRLAMKEIKSGRRKTKSGKPPGRPRRVTPEKAAAILALRTKGLRWREVAVKVGLPKGTCAAVYAAWRVAHRGEAPSVGNPEPLDKVHSTQEGGQPL